MSSFSRGRKITHCGRLALTLAASLIGGSAHAASVTIDCAVGEGPANHVANGYLVSMTDTQPASSLISPLKPYCYRSGWQNRQGIKICHNRLYSLGTRDFQATLAYNFNNPYKMNEIGYTYSISTWTTFVAGAVNHAKANGWNINWDIFNEPDLGAFRSYDDEFNVWKTAYQTIRANDPNAKIVGPSVAYLENLNPFLLRAKAENVFPDIVSVHLYGDPASARGQVANIRNFLISNGMGDRPISVNEILGQGDWFHAGYTAGSLAAFDRAGVLNAHHACWPDPVVTSKSCCNADCLDGILATDSVSTRSCWWVYKAYAAVTGQKISVTTSTDRIDGIAGLDSVAGGINALLGKYGDDLAGGANGITTLYIRNIPSYLNKNGTIRITAGHIADTIGATVTSVPTDVDVNAVITNGNAQVDLPKWGYNDAYQVRIGDFTGGPVTPPPPPAPPAGAQAPYPSTAFTVPGTIYTAQYDRGGESIAYHDQETTNLASGTYRPGEAVDSNGSGVGWIVAGEWMEYTVNVSAAGAYNISIPVSLPATGASMHVNFNGVNATGILTIPNTGSWSTFQNITKAVTLNAGTQVMQVAFDTNASNGYGPGLGDIAISSSTPAPTPTPPGPAGGNGLSAQYFDNADFTGSTISRVDSTVNFNWNTGSPASSIGSDTFSARWTGQVQAQYSQTYTFYVTADDGVRLWVNGNLLIDKWLVQVATEYSGTIALTAGGKYDIKLEYYENLGYASAQLAWSSASTAKAVIPASQLYSTAGQTAYGGTPMAIPGTVKVAQYDNGGEGVAFHDTDSFNQMSNTFRPGLGVDSNGTDVGWISATEWLEYTVNVSSAGTYTISIPLSHPGAGGAMHVSVNGINVTGSLILPTTSSWDTYQTMSKSVTLSAGVQVMQVAFDANGSTGYGPGLKDITVTLVPTASG